jgi:predicted GTPase
MKDDAVDVQLALVSHTNNGKTTLTRTLLGADVGEVRDAAHVTIFSESHTLLATAAGDALRLWDTPGFGDSVRLLKRLGMSDNPIGWFLREVLDRYRDRTFWLGQQALRTARDAADVVLYLVNASETPQDAGYLDAEMQILAWLGKPVLVLLNQVGAPRPAAQEQAERALWRTALDKYPLVREVLPLDAFARCWVHERVFYDAVAALLPPEKVPGYRRLLEVWRNNNVRRFDQAMHLTATQLASAAREREAVPADDKSLMRTALQAVGIGKNAQQRREDRAMQALVTRFERGITQTTAALLALYKLDPGAAAAINTRVRENFVVRTPIDEAQAGLLGAIVSGATSGLTAEILSGGLTAGLGALIGGVVGAVTFAGAARGYNASTDRMTPGVTFTEPFLRNLVVTGVLRYLAIIHFGRGRGQFVESEAPRFWQEHVEQEVTSRETTLRALWQAIRDDTDTVHAALRMQQVLADITMATLVQLYPDGAIESGLNQT